MKYIYSFSIILTIFYFNLSGQTILLSKNQTTHLHENRKLIMFFNYRFLPFDFKNKEEIILKTYSNVTGYPVHKITREDLRKLRKNNVKDYYIIEICCINERCRSPFHAINKIRSHSYYSFVARLSENNARVSCVNSNDTVLSEYEAFATCHIMCSLLNSVLDEGITWKNYGRYVNKNQQLLQHKTLYYSDDIEHISFPEKEKSFPSKIEKAPKQEIIQLIKLKQNNFAYTFVSHVCGSAGRRFNTVIVDGNTGKVLMIHTWKKE